MAGLPSPTPPKDGTVWRSVTSQNPDKRRIQAALRAAVGARGGKVTMVRISKDGSKVCGHVMVPDRKTRQRRSLSYGIVVCAHPDA